MPLPSEEKKTLKAATALLIEDGDVKEILTGLYGTVFDSNDRYKILSEVSHGERMMTLLELYETKASSLASLITVLESYTLQPHIALELRHSQMSPDSEEMLPVFLDPIFANFRSSLIKFYTSNFNSFKPIAQMGISLSMENCWTNLSMESDSRPFQDYVKCLTEALSHGQPVIIAGEPGIGKSTLMKRIAFDWTKGNLPQYDIVLCARMREVTRNVDSILDLTECWLKRKLAKMSWQECHECWQDDQLRLLLILDGLDESSCDCSELDELLYSVDGLNLGYDIIITSRPYMTNRILAPHQKINILGFTDEQQLSYVEKHFCQLHDEVGQAEQVKQRLIVNFKLREVARIPLILGYLCVASDKLKSDYMSELYEVVIGCMVSRFIKEKQPNSKLFGNDWKTSSFIQNLGALALSGILSKNSGPKVIFTLDDLKTLGLDDRLAETGLLNCERDFNPVEGEIEIHTFAHKTMQEFLAAFYLFIILKGLDAEKILPALKSDIELLPDTLQNVLRFHNSWQMIEIFQFLLELVDRKGSDQLIDLTMNLFLARWWNDPNDSAAPQKFMEDFWRKIDLRTFYSLIKKCSQDDAMESSLSSLIFSVLQCHSSYDILMHLSNFEKSTDIFRLGTKVYYFQNLKSIVCTPGADIVMKNSQFTSSSLTVENITPIVQDVSHFFANMDVLSEAAPHLNAVQKLEYLRIHVGDKFLTNDAVFDDTFPSLPQEIDTFELCLGVHRSLRVAKWVGHLPEPDSGPRPTWILPICQFLAKRIDKVDKLIIYGSGRSVHIVSAPCEETKEMVSDVNAKSNTHCDSASAPLSAFTRTIKIMVLFHVTLHSDSIEPFCQEILQSSMLNWLEIAYCKFKGSDLIKILTVAATKGFEHLVLSGETSLIDPAIFWQFIQVLKKWPAIQHLGLNSHIVTEKSLQLLASDVLPIMHNLSTLQLYSNVITQEQKIALEKANSKVTVSL